MANLSNVEGNINFQICLKEVAEKKESGYETWICCGLDVTSNVVNVSIGKQDSFMLNKEELDNLSNHLTKLLNSLEGKREYLFDFSNYECNFEVKMSTVVVDETVEVEVWINWGNYTNGNDAGYDVGIRYVVDTEELKLFINDLNEEKRGLFS